ncbi:MAG: zf-HC2 domain-containing protein [Sulfuritalea sp.]|nr:zf-HC2 domain-containing protein [Sulfuritalea sp.]
MTEPPSKHSPDMQQLSAYLDGELDSSTRHNLADHLDTCPLCASQLARLQTLTADFGNLPQETLGFDLAGVIEGRLAAAPRPPEKKRPARWWGLLPVSIGAAASIAVGVGMGSALLGGAAAMPRVTAMSVFDTLPPGGLCLGPDSCYSNGARK